MPRQAAVRLSIGSVSQSRRAPPPSAPADWTRSRVQTRHSTTQAAMKKARCSTSRSAGQAGEATREAKSGRGAEALKPKCSPGGSSRHYPAKHPKPLP